MKFSKEHAWVEQTSAGYKVGLTEYAQHELGEIVFVELPQVGKRVSSGGTICSIDSLKSASDVYAPFDGEIVEVNKQLEGEETIHIINDDPSGEGWICIIQPDNKTAADELLDESEYRKYIGEDHENSN